MTTFKEFKDRLLTESAYESKEMTLDEAVNYARTHCKHALSAAPIFRGSRSEMGSFNWINPNSGIRKSAHTLNYYNLILSNSRKWKEYPKRDSSLICVNKSEHARGYGKTYIVLPEDGAKLGVCPEFDMWHSFKQVLRALGTYTMKDFNETYVRLASYLSRMAGKHVDPRDDDYYFLVEQCNLMDVLISIIDKENPGQLDSVSHDEAVYYFITKSREGIGIYEAIDGLLDPKTNGFKTIKINDFHTKPRGLFGTVFVGHGVHEIWTDSPCLMIAHDEWEAFKAKL